MLPAKNTLIRCAIDPGHKPCVWGTVSISACASEFTKGLLAGTLFEELPERFVKSACELADSTFGCNTHQHWIYSFNEAINNEPDFYKGHDESLKTSIPKLTGN
ncbi:MAG: hypothetical protein V3T17_04265 [Pseudomonadales bacterium]